MKIPEFLVFPDCCGCLGWAMPGRTIGSRCRGLTSIERPAYHYTPSQSIPTEPISASWRRVQSARIWKRCGRHSYGLVLYGYTRPARACGGRCQRPEVRVMLLAILDIKSAGDRRRRRTGRQHEQDLIWAARRKRGITFKRYERKTWRLRPPDPSSAKSVRLGRANARGYQHKFIREFATSAPTFTRVRPE